MSTRRSSERMTLHRRRVLECDVARHREFEAQPRLKVVIGGSSGLVGTRLTEFLVTGGHTVTRLVRGGPASGASDTGTIPWDPARGILADRSLEGFDAVVHLGGVSVAKRFTTAHKAAVRQSRVESTRLLAESMASLTRKPRVFIVASAVGYYGDRGDELVDESSARGSGFLPDVCDEWEKAADAARNAGVRVVHARLGVVLSAAGGALAAMLPAFRFGVGGVVGSGRQYMSWIAIHDVVGALHHLVMTDDVRGPVNLTAPQPATNREFTKTLGRVLRRPTVVPLAAFVVKLLLGEMGETLLLEGCRTMPRVLERSGYKFALAGLEDTLRWELGCD